MATGTRGRTTAVRLPWTGDAAADRLLAEDPLALLIGFVLDQQVTVQKAMSGPTVIRERLGTIDAGALAGLDPEQVRRAFATPPAIHRYPRSMADRVMALCALITERYGGDASRLWSDTPAADTLIRRLRDLPGFGPMKATTVLLVVVKRLGVPAAGWERHQPAWPTLSDCDTPEKLAAYQTAKRAHKAELRAAAANAPKRSNGRKAAAGARARPAGRPGR